jgi:hypothetical protein
MTTEERLAKIAELLPAPCPEPGIAGGVDACVCGSGETFPCSITRAAWLARGLDPGEEIQMVLAPIKRQMGDAGVWMVIWMRTPKPPAPRISWSAGDQPTVFLGHVGTLGPWVFKIYQSAPGSFVLTARLPCALREG